MTHRANDGASGKEWARDRAVQSVYGFLLTLVGLAIMCWLPVEVWLRHLTGWALVVLGGMMIAPATVKEWMALVGETIFRKKG